MSLLKLGTAAACGKSCAYWLDDANGTGDDDIIAGSATITESYQHESGRLAGSL